MLRRALLAVAVLSYLICVLVLSGGQKDDINGKSSSQLAKYNVNVENLFNNEDLYKSCRNNSNLDISKTLLNTSSFQKVIKQLHDLSNDPSRNTIDKYKINHTEATKPEKVIIARDKRTAVTNNFDGHTNLFERNANKNVKNENKPDLKNVISFWQRFSIRDQNNTNNQKQNKTMLSNFLNKTNNDYFSKLIINKNLRDKDIIEGEYLGSILPPFLPKHITTKPTTTTTPKDLVTDDDTDIFKYILDSPDNESVEKHDINAHVNQYSYEINYSKIVYKNNNKSKNTDNSSEKDKPYRINEYENFKTDNSQHNINFQETDIKKPKTKHKNFIRKKEKPMSINNDYKPDSNLNIPVHDEMDVKYSIERTHYLYTTRKPEESYDKIYNDEQTPSTLPPEVIKKIAEDVKAMILNDLKSKTTTTLPVTIEKGLDALIPRYNAEQNLIPRYNPDQNLIPRYNGQNMPKPYPLTKILDILQKYRNGENLSEYRRPSETVPIYSTTKQSQNPNIYPYYLPIANKPLKFENNSPYMNPYNYKPAQPKIPSRVKFEVQKPKNFIPKRDTRPKTHISNNFKSTPITLQTNLIEIPPIGVPISEPLAFLNHHVIISTKRPFRNKQRNYQIKKDLKTKNTSPIKHKPVRTRNIHPRINENIGYHKKKQETDKKRMSAVDESRETKTTKPRGVYRPRSQSNIKKFHEKLEQYPKTYKANADCCKDEIFTSEQLAGAEMRSRDEISFRNLLKTQQKVTEMLTQMLAKRKKEDLPLSVEAA